MTKDLAAMLGSESTGTFLGMPSAALDNLPDDVDVVVMGAPCATAYQWVGPYSANSPAGLRATSSIYSGSNAHHNFDLGGSPLPAGVCVDIGDLPWSAEAPAANRATIQAAVEQVLAVGAVPVVLGGDDSIPIPVIAGYNSALGVASIDVLQLDAHIDWREEVRGERWGLSSTMRRASEMAHVRHITQVGRRGVGSARAGEIADALDYGVRFFDAHAVHRDGTAPIAGLIEPGSHVFITIDVDGLDPSLVPGVVGPEPGGLTYWHAIELIDAVADRATIAGFDVVEFVPERDVNGIGALTVFRLTAHAIGRILQSRHTAD